MALIQANYLVDIMNIEDTRLRNQRILDEVQPLARRIMDSFIAKYGERDSYLLQLKIHTHEQAIKTTITDSKNPKYAEKKKHYGDKGFVELIDEKLYESPLFILKLEFHLASREIRMVMSSDFYPFWVLSKRSRVHELKRMVEELDAGLQIFTIEEKKNTLEKSEFTDTVWQYIKNKRKPMIYFGKILPLEGLIEEEEIVHQLWDTYQKLTPVRSVLEKEAEEHSQGLLLMKKFQDDVTPIQMELFAKTYEVKIDAEVKKVKTNEYKQMFYIYDQDQLITEGHFAYFTRDPHESLGIIINNRGYIYHRIRKLATRENYEWFIKKAFYHRGKYNENNENQMYQDKTVEELKNHHFTLNESNAFYVGTYIGNNEFFTEPITKIKERLITAAAIFADVREFLTFPKGAQPIELPEEDDDIGAEVEDYSSSFDLTSIMDLVEQSGFTFSLDIIRDFYLNLTSLDDKHFVILSGISGTGKTQLCRVFANAVYGLGYGEDNPYLKIVPVRPDWMDATSLFGYYSSFEKRYMKTEFLDMLLQANEEKDKPHFIVLDEMNLARVEYYLSDYLSAVESRKPIQLHNIDDLKGVPKTIEIPHNFYVIGTINVDETTHSISDKVLDRSFVMTLSDVDFTSFWDQLDDKFKKTVQLEWELLIELHRKLAKYDLHFGYRTMNEMIRKLYKNSMLPEELRMKPFIALDRVVLFYLYELESLLKIYRMINDLEIQRKASQFLDWISIWKKAEFLQGIKPHSGAVKITQVFRKHPVYRLWYQWFQSLYQFKTITFDLEQKLSLKDTYLLYEMWCSMQIIRTLRELDLLEDTAEIFTKKDGYYFLRLAENTESIVKLKNGAKLVYQKIIQSNTNPYYSYTQRMIPDIVIDYQHQLFVMDPKYRIPANLPMALGEMHKYRDGILARENDSTVVKEVYILTPTECYRTSDKDFYDEGFHERYKMGAYCFSPGKSLEKFKEWIKYLFKLI